LGEETSSRGVVLVGTAGTGKTQQAARLAQRAWDEGRVDLLVWVTASRREAVVAAYAQALGELTGSDTAAPEQAAQAFLAWLRPDTAGPRLPRRRWLVVLDDVADPEDLRGLWPPDHPDGQTLVTTRRRDIAQPGAHRVVVPVAGFTADEATAYLREILAAYGRDSGMDEELQFLAGELGHLPLALTQAAAQLTGTGLDCAAYVRLLREYDLLAGGDAFGRVRPRRGQPLAELVPGPGALPDGQVIAAPEAWRSSLDRADLLPPAGLARPLLELASLLPAEGAPESIFTDSACTKHLTEYQKEHHTEHHNRLVRADDVREALRVLDRLGIIDYAPADPYRAVRVHPVLQRATREALPADRVRGLAWVVASALVQAADAQESDPGFVPVLVGAVDVLRGHADPALWSSWSYPRPEASSLIDGHGPSPTDHEVLFRVGEVLGTTGRAEAARGYFERLAGEALDRQGPYAPALEFSRLCQAHWQGESGDAAGAVAAYTTILDEQCRFFGPHHPRTMDTRAALGRWRGAAGDAAGAVAAYAALLPLQQHTFGPDYTAVLDTRAQLARWQGESGDAYGAAVAYEALLNDLMRVLGQYGGLRHPRETPLGDVTALPNWLKVFDAHHGHAHWRARAGDPAGAATSLTYLLNEQIRVLGPDHPRTVATRQELSHWTERAGNR
jgi:hypothetical protein